MADLKQVVTLRNRIDELETALKAARTQPPDSVSDLAQGKDHFFVTFTMNLPEQEAQISNRSTNWDELFALLGPSMLDEFAEQSLRSQLRPFLWPSTNYHVVVDDDGFHQIIIQFLALGLIERSKKQHAR